MEAGLDLFFVLLLLLFVCLLEFLVFLNRNFSFSNGLFCLYSLHQGGGAGRGGGGAGGARRREMGLILNCEWKNMVRKAYAHKPVNTPVNSAGAPC